MTCVRGIGMNFDMDRALFSFRVSDVSCVPGFFRLVLFPEIHLLSLLNHTSERLL